MNNSLKFILALSITVWIGLITYTFLDYREFYCVNIDLPTHINIVKYYANQPRLEPTHVCPNFMYDGFPEYWWHNHVIGDHYITNVHQGIAQLAIWLQVDAAHLLNWIGIFSMWLCFGLSCAIAHKLSPGWWVLNVALLVLSPEYIWRFVSNGWITQNLITLVMLGLSYWVVKSRRRKLMVVLTTFSALLLLAFIHNPIPLLLVFTNSLDTYRSLYTIQFFIVPGIFLIRKLHWRLAT